MPAVPLGFTPTVKTWFDKLALKSEGTAKGYFSNLKTYWNVALTAESFSTIDDWVAQVKQEQKSDEVNVRRTWAVNLESFINAYVSPYTKRLLNSKSKNVMRSAVENYLTYCLGDRLETKNKIDYGTKIEQLLEQKAKEDTAPISREEIAKLYTQSKNRRNRAIISTLMCGFGISEWLQFTHEWSKYSDDIRNGKVPIRVVVTRQKTGITYACYLWDDAVSDLKELLDERERDVGRQLTDDDPLFVNQSARPIQDQDVAKTIRRLAVGSGVEERHGDADKGKSYRFRSHEIGRDFFKTQAQLTGIRDIVSEYLLGHKVDPLEYGKFHKTNEGKTMIQSEASKLRPVLNIRTGKGQSQSEDDAELELLGKYAKVFLPKAYNAFREKFPNIATARALDKQEAIQYLKELIQPSQPVAQLPLTKRWSNHEYDYVKAAVESDDYDQALADGYEDFQSNGNSLHVLRRKKTVGS